jgi:hypothetical protein
LNSRTTLDSETAAVLTDFMPGQWGKPQKPTTQLPPGYPVMDLPIRRSP